MWGDSDNCNSGAARVGTIATGGYEPSCGLKDSLFFPLLAEMIRLIFERYFARFSRDLPIMRDSRTIPSCKEFVHFWHTTA